MRPHNYSRSCSMFISEYNLTTLAVLERVSTCHGLLILLHERDERKRYTATKFWTPKDASPAAIIAELKAGSYIYNEFS